MIPSPEVILHQLTMGQLLPPTLFTTIDIDRYLDARDTSKTFEAQWLQTYNDLKSNWSAAQPPASTADMVTEIHRRAFLSTFDATQHPDLAAYVSDDFELIAWSSALHDSSLLALSLWSAYVSGNLPAPHPDLHESTPPPDSPP